MPGALSPITRSTWQHAQVSGVRADVGNACCACRACCAPVAVLRADRPGRGLRSRHAGCKCAAALASSDCPDQGCEVRSMPCRQDARTRRGRRTSDCMRGTNCGFCARQCSVHLRAHSCRRDPRGAGMHAGPVQTRSRARLGCCGRWACPGPRLVQRPAGWHTPWCMRQQNPHVWACSQAWSEHAVERSEVRAHQLASWRHMCTRMTAGCTGAREHRRGGLMPSDEHGHQVVPQLLAGLLRTQRAALRLPQHSVPDPLLEPCRAVCHPQRCDQVHWAKQPPLRRFLCLIARWRAATAPGRTACCTNQFCESAAPGQPRHLTWQQVAARWRLDLSSAAAGQRWS